MRRPKRQYLAAGTVAVGLLAAVPLQGALARPEIGGTSIAPAATCAMPKDEVDDLKAKWHLAAAHGDVAGHHEAARLLRHYLDGDGSAMEVDLGALASEVPHFEDAIWIAIEDHLRQDQSDGSHPIELTISDSGTFRTSVDPRKGYNLLSTEERDWFLSLGYFRFYFTVQARAELVSHHTLLDAPAFARWNVTASYSASFNDLYDFGGDFATESLEELVRANCVKTFTVWGNISRRESARSLTAPLSEALRNRLMPPAAPKPATPQPQPLPAPEPQRQPEPQQEPAPQREPQQEPAPQRGTQPQREPRSEPQRPGEGSSDSCPGRGCEGKSPYQQTGCSEGARAVSTSNITASTGAVAGTLKLVYSRRCEAYYAAISLAGDSGRRMRVVLRESDRVIDDDNDAAVRDFAATVMASPGRGECVKAEGVIWHLNGATTYAPAALEHCL
jgi:hypothetical protein